MTSVRGEIIGMLYATVDRKPIVARLVVSQVISGMVN